MQCVSASAFKSLSFSYFSLCPAFYQHFFLSASFVPLAIFSPLLFYPKLNNVSILSIIPSFRCFLSNSLQLPSTQKLFSNSLSLIFCFSANLCQGACQASTVWLLSLSACCPVVTAIFWHCTHVGERDGEWERHREKGEGQRRKARKQGNACRCTANLIYKYANAVAFVICKWEITER